MYTFAVFLVVLVRAQVIQGAVKIDMNKNYVTWAVALIYGQIWKQKLSRRPDSYESASETGFQGCRLNPMCVLWTYWEMDFKNNSHACWIVSEGCLWHRARVYICASGYWRARVRIAAAVFLTGYQSFESVG